MRLLAWKTNAYVSKVIYCVALVVYCLILFYQSYYIQRSETVLLLSSFLVMFLAFAGLSWMKSLVASSWNRFSTIALHVIPLFALTPLSTDVYRFLWDGELIVLGINPYDFTPNELISRFDSHYMKQLYQQMGSLSQGNYSCYPTVNQWYFAGAACVSDSIWINVLALRILMLASLIGVFTGIRKLLQKTTISSSNLHFLLWNPLFVIESTQNLHFEGLMLAFFLLAVFYLMHGRWIFAAVSLSIAIHFKLVPLVLLPFFLRWIGWKRSLQTWALTGLITLLLMFAWVDGGNYRNFLESLRLYFQQFEFNSMILKAYIEYGRTRFGYNRIQTFGPQLARYATMGILVLAWLGNHFSLQKMFIRMLFALLVYYLLASTVHPWYLILPLGISIFTPYRFMLVWSGLVLLTYVSYGEYASSWMSTVVSLEYGILVLMIVFEIIVCIKNRRRKLVDNLC